MITLLITKKFTSGALNENTVTEAIETDHPDIWKTGSIGIDHITNLPYIITDSKIVTDKN